MNRFWMTLLVLAGVIFVVADFFGPHYESGAVWDSSLFFVYYGFVGCVAIIWISKWMGKYWLLRDEEYYEPHRAPEPGKPGFAVDSSGEGSDV